MVKKWLVLFIAGWMTVTIAISAQEIFTVISATGKNFLSSEGGHSWQTIKPGDKVPSNGIFKTGKKSALRIIRADGSVVRLRGRYEGPLPGRKLIEKNSESRGFFAVLQELVGTRKLQRMAGTRSANLGRVSLRGKEGFRKWLSLLNQPDYDPVEIPILLEAAAAYRERPRQNRSLALLTLLATEFPTHPGLGSLAEKAREAFGRPAQFRILHLQPGGAVPIASGKVLLSGESLMIQSRSETESFPLIYLLSIPVQGQTQSVPLFPPMGEEESPLPPNTPLRLPEGEGYFQLDDNPGMEIIWAWICLAPVTERKSVRSAVQKVIAGIPANGFLAPELVLESAPPFCPQAFAFTFKHN